MIVQKEIILKNYPRGFHLITDTISKNLDDLPEKGLLNIFVKHTSAAISLNENADPSVRVDFKRFTDKLVPENDSMYTHTLEGSDDMPAHIKSSLFGQSVTLPVTNRKINLGTWQGIYFCEFRDYGGPRTLMLTVFS
ncbi:MAG: secondary thiamine-phosphate synthase enzyme YjbQ [Bacteroidales bacterium]